MHSIRPDRQTKQLGGGNQGVRTFAPASGPMEPHRLGVCPLTAPAARQSSSAISGSARRAAATAALLFARPPTAARANDHHAAHQDEMAVAIKGRRTRGYARGLSDERRCGAPTWRRQVLSRAAHA